MTIYVCEDGVHFELDGGAIAGCVCVHVCGGGGMCMCVCGGGGVCVCRCVNDAWVGSECCWR